MKNSRPLEIGVTKVGGAPDGYDASLLAQTAARADGPVPEDRRMDHGRCQARTGPVRSRRDQLPDRGLRREPVRRGVLRAEPDRDARGAVSPAPAHRTHRVVCQLLA